MLHYETGVITQEYGDIAIGDLAGKVAHVYSIDLWVPATFTSEILDEYRIVSLTPIIPDDRDWLVPDIDDVDVKCSIKQRWVSDSKEIIRNVQSGDIVLASAPDQNFEMCWIVNFVNDTKEKDTLVGAKVGPMALANGVCVYM
jgi:hypothetical protein